MPIISHLVRRHVLPNPIGSQGLEFRSEFMGVLVNGFVTGTLVLLGGLFAGLTLA